jgi:hypothetical protein
MNPRKWDQRFELGNTEVIKSLLVIAGLGMGFFSSWEIQQKIAMGLVRQINIPGLRIQRMFSWALPSGELGGLPGEFYHFANAIRSELSAVSVCPLNDSRNLSCWLICDQNIRLPLKVLRLESCYSC